MLNLWADTLALGLSATALLVLRLIMVPLLIFNISWSYKGFKWVLKGASFPTSIYQSVVFLMSMGLLGYHALTIGGALLDPWALPFSLALQCMFFLASLLAFAGRQYAIVFKFEQFYWLFDEDHLDIAVRAAQINKFDPVYADAVLDAAEADVALKMAKKALDRGPE